MLVLEGTAKENARAGARPCNVSRVKLNIVEWELTFSAKARRSGAPEARISGPAWSAVECAHEAAGIPQVSGGGRRRQIFRVPRGQPRTLPLLAGGGGIFRGDGRVPSQARKVGVGTGGTGTTGAGGARRWASEARERNPSAKRQLKRIDKNAYVFLRYISGCA